MCRGETALAVCTASMAVVVARGRRVPQPRQISLHATEEMRAMRSQVETLRSKMLSLQSETKHTRVQQQPEVPALRKATVTDDQSAALEAILLSEARAEKLMQELEAEDVRSKSLTEKLEALKAEQGAELQFTSTTQVEELVEELEAQESKVGTLKEALKEEVEELADEAENFEHKALLDASLLKVDEVEPPQGALPEDDLMRDIAELKAELADAEKRRLALQRGPATRQEKENEARKGGRQERVEKEKETGATTGEAQVEATAGVAQTEARPSAVAAGPDNDKMQLQQQQQQQEQQQQMPDQDMLDLEPGSDKATQDHREPVVWDSVRQGLRDFLQPSRERGLGLELQPNPMAFLSNFSSWLLRRRAIAGPEESVELSGGERGSAETFGKPHPPPTAPSDVNSSSIGDRVGRKESQPSLLELLAEFNRSGMLSNDNGSSRVSLEQLHLALGPLLGLSSSFGATPVPMPLGVPRPGKPESSEPPVVRMHKELRTVRDEQAALVDSVKSMASGLSSALVLVLEILHEHSSRVQSIEDGSFSRLGATGPCDNGSCNVDDTAADVAGSGAAISVEGAVGLLRLLFAGLTLDRCMLLLLAAWNLLLQPRRRHSSSPEVDAELALDLSASTTVASTHGPITTACHAEQLNCNANTISGATGRRMLRELRATRRERRPDCTQHRPALAAHSALASSSGLDQAAMASLMGNLPNKQPPLPGVAASVTGARDHGRMQASPPGRPSRNSRIKNTMKSRRSWHNFQPQPSDSGEGDLQHLAWGLPQAPPSDSGEASDAEREGLGFRNSFSAAAAVRSVAGCLVRSPAGTSPESAATEVRQRKPAAVPAIAMATSRRGGHERSLTATSQESASQGYPHSPQSGQAATSMKGASAAANRMLPKRYSSAARRHVLSQQHRATAAESGGGSASGGNSSRYR